MASLSSGDVHSYVTRAQLGQHGLHRTLAKAEVAQRRENQGERIDALRRGRVTVGGAIRVPEND